MTEVRNGFFRERYALAFDGPGRTQQAFKKQCDINNILARFEKTGLIEHVKKHAGMYGEFLDAPDYHVAMNSVVNAQQMFEELPAKMRKRFGNDPGEFLTFVDTASEAELREAGILPPVVPEAVPAPEAPVEAPSAPVEPA